MKKILNILGIITLIETIITSLVACDKPQFTEEKLKKLKEENKINTINENIKNNLELITPQENPFNNVDNRYYFVIWHGNENDDWRIILFKFENTNVTNIDQYGKYIIQYSIKQGYNSGLLLGEKRNQRNILIKRWEDDNKKEYFKFLYRWNDDSESNVDIKNKLKSYLNL